MSPSVLHSVSSSRRRISRLPWPWYEPRSLPAKNWVRLIATKSPIEYLFAVLRFMLKSLLLSHRLVSPWIFRWNTLRAVQRFVRLLFASWTRRTTIGMGFFDAIRSTPVDLMAQMFATLIRSWSPLLPILELRIGWCVQLAHWISAYPLSDWMRLGLPYVVCCSINLSIASFESVVFVGYNHMNLLKASTAIKTYVYALQVITIGQRWPIYWKSTLKCL